MPGVDVVVPVELTGGTISVRSDKFSRQDEPGVVRYPRGATVTFRVRNEGKVPLTLVLRIRSRFQFYEANILRSRATTGTLAPAAVKPLRATFTFRGPFEFELLRHGKVVAKRQISIF